MWRSFTRVGFNERTKSIDTPSQKMLGAEFARRSRDPELSTELKAPYRSDVVRMCFIAQGRGDETVANLAQSMQNSKICHMGDLKRAAQYLLHRPSLALSYKQQKFLRLITLWVDSDHAADK